MAVGGAERGREEREGDGEGRRINGENWPPVPAFYAHIVLSHGIHFREGMMILQIMMILTMCVIDSRKATKTES